MAKMRFDGFKELQRDLKRMEQNARKLEGKHEIPLVDLCNPAFMRRYTGFSSISELFQAGGFRAAADAEFSSIPREELDAHIARTTKFQNWDELLDKAVSEYVRNQMGF